VFGSVARGEDTATSDIDFLVDLDDGVGLFDLIGLERELRELLGGRRRRRTRRHAEAPYAGAGPQRGHSTVSRRDDERLADILAAAEAIACPTQAGRPRRWPRLRRRPRAAHRDRRGSEGHRPGAARLRVRHPVARRGWDTAHSIVQATVGVDLPPLVAAVQRLVGSTRRASEPEASPPEQTLQTAARADHPQEGPAGLGQDGPRLLGVPPDYVSFSACPPTMSLSRRDPRLCLFLGVTPDYVSFSA